MFLLFYYTEVSWEFEKNTESMCLCLIIAVCTMYL